LRSQTPKNKPTVMDSIIYLIVIATSIWVYFDARKIGIKRISRENPGGKNIMNMGPVGWAICTLLLWIVMFPVYLIKRPGLKKQFQPGAQAPTTQITKEPL